MKKRLIAFLVPAHNEEAVIADTIKSLLEVADKKDIYVVNDGSIDGTEMEAKKLVSNVLTLNPNKGKATAMNLAIKHFKLAKNYEYLMPMDADTKITKSFLDNSLPLFKGKKIACVVGKVIGKTYNAITTYRLWEYEVAQTIHKSAQNIENAIIVCPGCSTIYRADIFDKIEIPTGTLTEDMDFTFLIHRQNLGQIVYTDRSVVVTQDPKTITDFLKQIDRWYTGFWQCVRKHNIPWGNQMLDLEVGLLALEGLYNGLLSVALIIFLPFVITNRAHILIFPLLIDLILFIAPTLILTSKRHHNWLIFRYLPFFYLLRVLSSLVFLKSFIKVIFSFDLSMSWGKAKRYSEQTDQVKRRFYGYAFPFSK